MCLHILFTDVRLELKLTEWGMVKIVCILQH